MVGSRFDTWSDPLVSYAPRRWKAAVGAVIALAVAALLGLPALRAMRAAGGLDPHVLSPLAVAIACIVFGLSALAGLAAGLPRLSATSAGLRLDTMFGTSWANWSSLSAFDIRVPRYTRRGAIASADIIGREVSPNLRHRRRFVLPDTFRLPLPTVVEQLDMVRPDEAGWSRRLPMEDDRSVGVEHFTRPWLTYAMVCGLVVVFIIELARTVALHSRGQGVSLTALYSLGALDRDSVVTGGEWYRIFLAPLLHGSLAHLLGNAIALLLAGRLLEQLAGRSWMLAIFVLGAFGGSMMSMATSAPDTISVGASGAIMALFAAIPVLTFRLPAGDARSYVQGRTIRILIPLLLPAAADMHIDYGAHLGGALVGLAAGWVLLVTWPETSRLPRFQGAAQAIICIWVLLLTLGTDELASGGRLYPMFGAAGSPASAVCQRVGQQPCLAADDAGRVVWLVERRADAETRGPGGTPGGELAGIDAAHRYHQRAGGQYRA